MSVPDAALQADSPGVVPRALGPGARARRRRRPGHFDGLFSDVQWTPAFIGLLLYIFSIVTYRAPLATPGLALALAAIFLGGQRIRVPPVLIAFGAFIVWGLIGYTQTIYPGAVWDRLILLGKLWLISLVLVNALRTRAQIRFFVVFFLVCFATHPARGAIFNYFYGYTLFGRALWNHIYANPNDLAALTLFPLGLAIGLLKDVNTWIRRGAVVSVVVLVALVLMTQSRGGFLALALVGVIAVFRLRTERRKARTFAGIVLMAGAAAFLAPSGVWDRISGLSEGTEADSSSQQRWEIWQVAREVASDHKLYGVGLGAYRRAHFDYTLDNPLFTLSRGVKDTHSTYLNVLAEAGWPGLLIFLTMIGLALNEARRAQKRLRHDPAAKALIGAVALVLVGYMAAGIFATVPHLSFLYIHLALLTVLSRAAMVRRRRRVPAWTSPAPSPPGSLDQPAPVELAPSPDDS
jgi:probable O-glycosylation ligase (exosortase A-associated)